MTDKPLSRDDLQVLFGMDCGLPAIQRDLELAARIGYYPEAHESRHRALNFAFRHAPTAVITVTVMHLSEALELQLERASLALLGRSLWVGRGRDKRLVDPDFQRLYELRVARVGRLTGGRGDPGAWGGCPVPGSRGSGGLGFDAVRPSSKEPRSSVASPAAPVPARPWSRRRARGRPPV